MIAHRLFPDRDLLKKKLVDFFRGREQYLEAFEGKYGKIPEAIRESVPYRYRDISDTERITAE